MDCKKLTSEQLVAILDKATWATSDALIDVLDELGFRGDLPEHYQRMVKTQEDIDDMLKESGLDWEVDKWPILYQNPDNPDEVLSSPSYGLVRLDNRDVLKRRCEDGYFITQNRDTLTYIAEVAHKANLKLQKAYCLDGGRKVMVMMEVPGELVVGNDTLTRYVYAIDSHDGSTGLAIGFSDTVMSCKNQFYSFYNGQAAKIRHTSGLGERIALMVKFIRDNQGQLEAHNINYLKMASTKAQVSIIYDLIQLLTEVHFLEDDLSTIHGRRLARAEALRDAITSEMEEKGATLWGLFNGVTYYYNHEHRSDDSDDDRKLDLAFGKSHDAQNKAYSFLLNYIK